MFLKRNKPASDAIPPKELTTAFAQTLAPFLKEHGYLKFGTTWNREYPEFIAVINIQGSKWNTTGEPVEFCINYAIVIADFYEECNNKPLSLPAREYDGVFRARLTDQEFGDHWWKISRLSDIEPTAAQVRDWLSMKAFPLFDSIQSRSDMLNIVKNHAPPSRIATDFLEKNLN